MTSSRRVATARRRVVGGRDADGARPLLLECDVDGQRGFGARRASAVASRHVGGAHCGDVVCAVDLDELRLGDDAHAEVGNVRHFHLVVTVAHLTQVRHARRLAARERSYKHMTVNQESRNTSR